MSPDSAAACRALVGLQWGDEGKGKLIDWLAAEARHVARFQGGHNAGHTVVVEDRRFVLHLLPSGVINDGCRCYIGQGVALDLAALLEEIETLRAGGVDCAGRLAVSPHCALVMPHHVKLDEARERQAAGRIGTTLRGIGPAQEDRAARCAVRLGDVLAGDGAARIEASVARANCQLRGMYGEPELDAAAIGAATEALAARVKPCVADVAAELEEAARRGEPILLEGAQGALLDIEQGSYPFVTSSSCLASGSAPGLGVDLRPEVVGVAKAYVTRVGMGALPTRIEGDAADFLVERGGEFGATTARRRDVGWLDIPALRHALRVNACGRIALTKLDVLGLLDRIKVCVAYRLDGAQLDSWPPSDRMLRRCEPEWIELPGWGELPERVAAYEELPAACRDYVARVEELAGARVAIVSCGQERGATLWRT